MSHHNATQIWAAALGQLQLSVNKANYDTWLRETIGLRFEDEAFVVGTNNDFTREWLDIRMRKVIVQALARVVGHKIDVMFEVAPPAAEDDLSAVGSPVISGVADAAGRPTAPKPNLHPALTFDAFVVGEENELAYAAAQSVVNSPGRTNPLVIFGGSGLGKTHLLSAIGHASYTAGLTVAYATAERFGTEFGTAAQQKSFDRFRRRYRECDVLLVDDIQFFETRPGFQEEFYHTLDALHAAGKQVVVTCDRVTSQIHGLSEALRSRLMWGVQADVRRPSFPTRLAILRAKAAHHAFRLPEEALERIAERCCPTVRELEGYLNRVVMHLPLIGGVATPEAVDRALNVFDSDSSSAQPVGSAPEPDAVIAAVCVQTNTTRAQLVGRSRNREVSYARHLAMYVLKHEAHKAISEIQRLFGNRDHSTVIGAIDRIEGELATRPETAADLQSVRAALNGAAVLGTLPDPRLAISELQPQAQPLELRVAVPQH